MKKFLGVLFISFMFAFSGSAQIPDGSTAPDFVLTDLDGNTHHLYDYLAQGKVVFIKFFACHCPSCWGYYNTGKLETIYNTYGPPGTDQVMVLMIEHDQWNGYNEFHGLSPNTQGDWVTGNPIPIIDAEDPDRGVFTDYNMTYYPMIFKVCPDKKTELMSTTYTVSQLYQEADDCPGTLAVEEHQDNLGVRLDFNSRDLVFDNFDGDYEVQLVSLMGQEVLISGNIIDNRIDVSSLSKGVYIIKVRHGKGVLVKKIKL